MTLLATVLVTVFLALSWIVYIVCVQPLSSPLRNLPGPRSKKGFGFGGHLSMVLNTSSSKSTHQELVDKYGRNLRIKGLGNFEDRLLTTDPVALSYIMNHTNVFQKPWQSRRVIARLIGEGLLASEGEAHKRMRRVSMPAFSIQSMRALVPIAIGKAFELKDKWNTMIDEQHVEVTKEAKNSTSMAAKLDICHWISRAAFDIIGLAGFEYNFSAIQHEENELFLAYRDMFEIVVSRGETLWDIVIIYLPWLERLFPTEKTRTVQRSQEIINRIGGQLVKEKTKQLTDSEKSGSAHHGTDILSLLIRSNLSAEVAASQRLSDEEVLDNVNTFFFAGSDTTSLTLTWVLYLLAKHSMVQDKLRSELHVFINAGPSVPSSTDHKQEWQEFWAALDELPLLNNVVRETLRLISPLHSSIRVATRDEEIPTSEAIKMRDGSVCYGIKIKKGQFVHIPVDSMNTDKSFWGEDAWSFKPDRWDNLPAAVLELPGLYNHTLSFSAGPRSCIGMRFSLIVIKSFLYVLLSNFKFAPVEGERVFAANVVLVRPYVSGRFMEGSQCPLLVSRI